jgi:hypothetical protein
MPIRVASLRGVLVLALVWLAIAAIVAFEVWPMHPSRIGSWVLFVIVAPPLYLLASGLAEWAWTTRPGKFISEHPSQFVRISLGVIVIGGSLAAVSAIWLAIRNWTGS